MSVLLTEVPLCLHRVETKLNKYFYKILNGLVNVLPALSENCCSLFRCPFCLAKLLLALCCRTEFIDVARRMKSVGKSEIYCNALGIYWILNKICRLKQIIELLFLFWQKFSKRSSSKIMGSSAEIYLKQKKLLEAVQTYQMFLQDDYCIASWE